MMTDSLESVGDESQQAQLLKDVSEATFVATRLERAVHMRLADFVSHDRYRYRYRAHTSRRKPKRRLRGSNARWRRARPEAVRPLNCTIQCAPQKQRKASPNQEMGTRQKSRTRTGKLS